MSKTKPEFWGKTGSGSYIELVVEHAEDTVELTIRDPDGISRLSITKKVAGSLAEALLDFVNGPPAKANRDVWQSAKKSGVKK